MQVIETSTHKAWGFSTYFFHTLIKQRLFLFRILEELKLENETALPCGVVPLKSQVSPAADGDG
jgi:hypothetical protein